MNKNMKTKIAWFAVMSASILLVLGGCARTNDYTPAAGASGEQIFKEACVQCHSPVNGKVMVLKSGVDNAETIIERISTGKGIGMPAFPNLQGDSAQAVADYILANSATAE